MPGLTACQTARLASHRIKWQQTRHSTELCDRSTAEAGVRLTYRMAGLQPPESIVWCSGPMEVVRDWQRTIIGCRPGRCVEAQIFGDCRRSAHKSLARWADKPTIERIFNSDSNSTNNAIGASVGRVVRNAAQHVEQRDLPERKSLERVISNWLFGTERRRPFKANGRNQHDLGWLGSYEFLHDVCHLHNETAVLRGQWCIAGNVGWIVAYERVCWLSERHSRLHIDDFGRLHRLDGPALTYRDGWSAYAYKGVRLPPSVMSEKDNFTVEGIDNEHNFLLRRFMIEMMTPAAFVAMGGASQVAKDETGVLWRKSWLDGDNWAAVEVVNGTPGPDGRRAHYFLQVPPHIWTARAAVAWTYGVSERKYRRLVRRT